MTAYDDELAALLAETDPVRIAQRAGELISRHEQQIAKYARIRGAAVDELIDVQKRTPADLAKDLGISRNRIYQLRTGYKPGRAVNADGYRCEACGETYLLPCTVHSPKGDTRADHHRA